MTPPAIQKPRLLTEELSLQDYARRLAHEKSPALSLDFYRLGESLQFELFRPDHLPRFGSCGILRNNSVFGCDYLSAEGRETKLGMNLDTYAGGFGLSLKIFLGGH